MYKTARRLAISVTSFRLITLRNVGNTHIQTIYLQRKTLQSFVALPNPPSDSEEQNFYTRFNKHFRFRLRGHCFIQILPVLVKGRGESSCKMTPNVEM